MSHQTDQLLTCCSVADKDIEGTYLLINGQVQALCKQHEPVHFTVQGEDKTTVAVQAVTPLCDLCWLLICKLRFSIIYYEKQRLPLAKSLGLRNMTFSKPTSIFKLPQKLRQRDADRFVKRRPFLENRVLSPKNGVNANAASDDCNFLNFILTF